MNKFTRILKAVLPSFATRLLGKTHRISSKFTYRLYRHRKKHRNIDYYVVSFPKSGRTWLRTIIGKYFEGKYGVPFTTELKKITHDFVPRIEFAHDLNEIKYHKNKKVIYLIRDPRDVVVSYYHQLTKRRGLVDMNISTFVRSKKHGIQYIINYLNTMKKYEQYPSQVLWLSYEKLHEDTYKEAERFLTFIGMTPDPKKLKESISFAQFGNMQKMEREGKFDSERLKPGDVNELDSYKVRKGKIGNYKDELSKEDIDYVDEHISKHLQLSDYHSS